MKYKETHPWISFRFRADTSDCLFWLKMGEVGSKCEHLSGVPLRPEIADELHRIFLAKGVLATTAIEGNTLTEEQVLQQVEGKLELPPSQNYLKQEIDNIITACNKEVEEQLREPGKIELTPERIKSYNRQILHQLDLGEDVVPGQVRGHSVTVGNVYRGAPAADCEYLLQHLCDWLNGSEFQSPESDLNIPYAVLKAVIAHIYLAWIHPFGDGNGRTARLVEFHILFASGVPLPAAHLLSDHYNKTRSQYYRELDRASKSGGELMPFIKYALQGFLDGLRDQIARIRVQQLDVAWDNYVHNRFRDKKISPTQKRRRDLVLELSKHDWIHVSDIEELSPRLAKLYAVAGDRMLQRDLNAVEKMKLVERKYGRVRALRRVIEAFRPARVEYGS